MTENELQYEMGKRQAVIHILVECTKILGYNRKDDYAAFLKECEETIQQLRNLCVSLGDDLDWDNNTYIPDIIEKHVIPHVHKLIKDVRE